MHRSPLVLGLAAVFAGLTALLAVGAVVGGQPFALFVAAPLGLTSYFMYYHGSGKLARAVYSRRNGRRRRDPRRRRSTGGGFGAGPRSRGGPRTRAEREERARAGATGAGRTGRRGRAGGRNRSPPVDDGPTARQARDVLGVNRRADAGEIRRAYRERVKEVHPDRGGDEEAFKKVTAAYERLSD